MNHRRGDINHRRGDMNQGGTLTLTQSIFSTICGLHINLATLLGNALNYLRDKYEYITMRNDRVTVFGTVTI